MHSYFPPLDYSIKSVSSVNSRQTDSAPWTAAQRWTEVLNNNVQHEQTQISVQNEGFSNETHSLMTWEDTDTHTHTLAHTRTTSRLCHFMLLKDILWGLSLRLSQTLCSPHHTCALTHTSAHTNRVYPMRIMTWKVLDMTHGRIHACTHSHAHCTGIRILTASDLTLYVAMWLGCDHGTTEPLMNTHTHTYWRVKLAPLCQILLKKKKWL